MKNKRGRKVCTRYEITVEKPKNQGTQTTPQRLADRTKLRSSTAITLVH